MERSVSTISGRGRMRSTVGGSIAPRCSGVPERKNLSVSIAKGIGEKSQVLARLRR